MLSDEGKREYEAFKYYYQTNTEKGISYIPDYMCENVLNLIEKQSKEIEKLRKILVNDYGAERFWNLIDTN